MANIVKRMPRGDAGAETDPTQYRGSASYVLPAKHNATLDTRYSL